MMMVLALMGCGSNDIGFIRIREPTAEGELEILALREDYDARIELLEESLSDTEGALAGLDEELVEHDARLGVLEVLLRAESLTALAEFLVVEEETIRFVGANVFIQSGAGLTETEDGFGNLHVGYPQGVSYEVGASHNLTVGTGHTHESFAGVAAGYRNTTEVAYAAAFGGRDHIVRGPNSVVVGGERNVIDEGVDYAVVLGGEAVIATTDYAIAR